MTHLDLLKKAKEWDSGNYPVISRLDLLYPPFRVAVVQLMKISMDRGWPFRVFETFRSAKRQAFVCGQGYSQMVMTGPHNFGLAVDIVAYMEGRDNPWSWKASDAPWSSLGAAGEELGLVWGGRWKKPYDPAHFQCIVVDQKLYTRIRDGKYYPDWEMKIAAPKLEPQQLTEFRKLYDAAAYMPLERREPFLRTLNKVRPYISEEEPEGV